MAGRLASIHVSQGGVPKLPVPEATVGPSGLAGDQQRYKFHGGPERAVCLFSAELIAGLVAEGHPIVPGSTGENLTVSGIPWAEVVPGARLRVGEVLLEVTSYTTPCAKIVGSFRDGDSDRISQERHPGQSRVYARVLQGGTVRPGDEVELIPASGR
jgi:MOSC domain-containing protein YiiM